MIRRLFAIVVVALSLPAIASCGGGSAVSPPQTNPAGPSQGGGATPDSSDRRVDVALSSSPANVTLPLSGGYSGSLTLAARGVPAGTKIQIGVRQPTTAYNSSKKAQWHRPSCPSTLTIPLFNPFRFAIVLDVRSFSFGLPCTVDGTLFGVSFYQVQPAPTMVSSVKMGDVTANGRKLTFTSDVTEITLPPRTETAISVIPESSTSEVGIPVVPGAPALLTSNAPSISSSLTVNYGSTGGGGSLYSSACFPAIVNGVRNPLIASAIIEGIPSYFCQLGTVDSSTVFFGAPTVTFTIGNPIPDRSFVSLDGPGGEFPCDTSASPTCTTPEFTVPVIQNVIVGNVLDLQACVPVQVKQNCNSNGNPSTPIPPATSVKPHTEISLLVADDPTYVSPGPGACSAPQICGGFTLNTAAGSCVIDNDPDENGDVPPGYNDPGGPQESPPVHGGTSTSAYFPAVGPYVEFDLITGGSWTTCSATITESDGPLMRSITYTIPVE